MRRREPAVSLRRGTGLLGLHRPGTSVLHRVAPGAKLGGLAVLGVAVVVTTGAAAALALLAVPVAAVVVARLPWRAVLRGLVPVLVVAVAIAAFQTWARGWATGVEVAADLVTLVLAAAVVTATTRVDRMLDTLARAARPLRRVGLRPDVVALSFALVLRTVPELARTAAEVRDAARARGLERSPRAVLVPTALRTVGRAHRVGEALEARGVVD